MSHHSKQNSHGGTQRTQRTRRFGLGVFVILGLGAAVAIYRFSVRNNAPPPVIVPAPVAASEQEIIRGNTSKKQLIFTFDGGAGATSSEQILVALAKHRVKGTFFLTGKFVDAHPDLVRRMIADGHEIFSHTYDHPHLTQLPDEKIASEFQKMEQSLEIAGGISPKPFFRAPYGDRDARVRDVAFKAGYESVYWTVDARDWQEPKGETADDVRSRILDNAAPGSIYLMHLGDSITGAILDDVFTQLEGRGYKLVSLTQGL